jgi:hypothetical protein
MSLLTRSDGRAPAIRTLFHHDEQERIVLIVMKGSEYPHFLTDSAVRKVAGMP